ncbi:gasdermin-D isoform X2 [Erinaceus europaeus]|uniref:Gasdermin-D isoform X2 n=1 Tax=Erinaceus europaeus TaxID=9365 RepID=A0ABM3XZJ0_ERIEU|nr:gasdermin-D isoform X2 [Erinaceus europaeus]
MFGNLFPWRNVAERPGLELLDPDSHRESKEEQALGAGWEGSRVVQLPSSGWPQSPRGGLARGVPTSPWAWLLKLSFLVSCLRACAGTPQQSDQPAALPALAPCALRPGCPSADPKHGFSFCGSDQECDPRAGPKWGAPTCGKPGELHQLPALLPAHTEALELLVWETPFCMCPLVHQGYPGAQCPRTSRGACGSLPLPRHGGRAAAGQCGAGHTWAGETGLRGNAVRDHQCLHECLHAARVPQHLDCNAEGETPAEARAQDPAATEAPWRQCVRGDGGAADTEGGGGHLHTQAGGLRPVSTAWGSVLPEIIFLPDKKQRTFGGGDQMPSSYKILKPFGFFSKCLLQSDAAHTENSLMLAQDFEDLQAEVEAQAEGLCILSPELCQQLLTGLGQVLRDEMTLHHLEELLEQGLCCGRVELQTGPVGDVLECLVQPCRMLEEELVEHFFYLLGALAELNEAQHMELAQMLEARAPLGPCSLVESLLEQSAPWQKPVPVSLPLGSSWGPEAPIWILLEECGLELKANAPHVRWVPEALDQTLALYACLALLSKLSQSQ